MVNHFWTCLLNSDVADWSDGSIGGIPRHRGFRTVPLTAEVESFRRALFAASPDAAFANYRGRQLLACVMASPLRGLLYAGDVRNTYADSIPKRDFLFPELYRPVAERISGSGDLSFAGENAGSDGSGRMHRRLTVEIDGGNSLSVLDLMTGNTSLGSSSDRVAMAGTGFTLAATTPAVDSQWNIEVLCPPLRTLHEVLADVQAAGEPALAAVFRGSEEPIVSMRTMFNEARETVWKLAAATLAYVSVVDARRLTRG